MVKSVLEGYAHMKPPAYPWIGVGRNSGIVVLFSAEKHGTVVSNPSSQFAWRVGDHHVSWDMDSFHPFTGRVILFND